MGLTFLIRIKIELILREHHVSPFEESVIGFLKMCFASPQPIVKAKWDLEAVEHLQVVFRNVSNQIFSRLSVEFCNHYRLPLNQFSFIFIAITCKSF